MMTVIFFQLLLMHIESNLFHFFNFQVPIGFGDEADQCLHNEFNNQELGTSKRLAPKCVEWLEKTEATFEALTKREKGNDKRESFVIFSTIFAIMVSAAVGYILGVFLQEHDDIFSYNNRQENKKILLIFSVAILIPIIVILWASPKLFMLMTVSGAMGRAAHFFVQRRADHAYAAVSGSDSGLVFAAIPIQMD